MGFLYLAAGWCELPEFHGPPRVQAVCAGQYDENGVRFYLWGGFAASTDEKPATLSTDGMCYSSVSQQWSHVATPIGNDKENAWHEVVRTSHIARAGAALVGQGKTYYHINGELKPGIRTSEIVKIVIE